MPNTTNYSITYPANTDLVTNGATQMQTIATGFDTVVYDQIEYTWGRNVVHNPVMTLNYRGSQRFTSPVSEFVVDRWRIEKSVAPTSTPPAVTLAQLEYLTPQTGLPVWVPNAAQILVSGTTTGVTEYARMSQQIEDVTRLAGQTCKVSFYARATSGTPKIGVSIDQVYGSGGIPSGEDTGTGTAVTISTTWTRYTVTLTPATFVGKTIGTDGLNFSRLNFWLTAGTNLNTRSGSIGRQDGFTFQITGVQVETDYVTELERRPMAVEEALCGRYFETTVGNNVFRSAGGFDAQNGSLTFTGGCITGGIGYIPAQFRWRKKVAPTIILFTDEASAVIGAIRYNRSGATGNATGSTTERINTHSFRAVTGTVGAVSYVVVMFAFGWAADTGW